MMPPTLQTERLTLRPMQLTDFDAYAEVLTTDRAQYMGGPYSRADAWTMFVAETGLWAIAGMGTLTAVTADGIAVAVVGFSSRHDPDFPEDELGWMAMPGHEGHGYVTEAAQAMRDWAFGPGGLADFVSYVEPANHRSIAVARRLGAVLDPTAEVPDPGDLVFRHRRPT
jgi:RimJ/RimL family protein N-acetyltransferase